MSSTEMAPPRVLKFGGSSLGAGDRLARVLGIVAEERRSGPIAVVVSAFGDSTDWLLSSIDAATAGDVAEANAQVDRVAALASAAVAAAIGAPAVRGLNLAALGSEILAPVRGMLQAVALLRGLSDASRDEILSFGERLSARLVAAAASATGTPAVAVDAREWLVTDDRHGDARVLWEPTLERLAGRPDDPRIPVHTGFIGATVAGRTTTLGRNGSDYTAALLARGIGASEVTLFTDVPGVLTADPKLVGEAYPVPALSYREALELSALGLRMLHPRTMVPLLEGGIPLRVRHTMRPEEAGTVVSAGGSADAARATCVTSLENACLVDVEGTHRSSALRVGPRVLAALAERRVPVWFETQPPHGNGVAFVAPGESRDAAVAALTEALGRELADGSVLPPRVHHPVTLVTLVAEAMGRTANVAGRYFGALGAIGVNVRAASQGATSRAISSVVDAVDTAAAVRAVHAAFNLSREQVNVLVLGKGTVGSQLLAQLGSEAPKLREAHDLDLRLTGLAGRSASVFDEAGLDPASAAERLAALGSRAPVDELLDRLARLPVPVLVDCTAADGMEAVYTAAFTRGVHVVTANKKVLALPLAGRDAVFAAARRAHRAFRYETTVGASLPVIETLKNLVRTGDRVVLVEGSLSGTLGYLASEVMRGRPLSEALADARARGYTEPHPREDLTGTDAARKALILARELGMRVDLTDVAVEPFVPSDLLGQRADPDEFLASLRSYDSVFAAQIERMKRDNLVLRYLARIEPTAARPSLRVGPVGVPADHAATRLRGSEAFVAFTTARYSELPLVVHGAGAGGAVTAAGVLADVLALSQALRGR
jgi:aspartokinase/homoserine dehydrogenase 1